MLARLLPARSPQRAYDPSGNSNVFYSFPGGYGLTAAAYGTGSGVEKALANAASWACLRVLMDALSRTPISAVRETKGVRFPVEPVPRILARPSGIVAVDVWRAQMGFSLCTDGNVFGKVADIDSGGHPIQIELLDAMKVTERKVVKGIPTVSVDHAPHQIWPFGDIWHMPGDMVMPGTPFGVSPLQYAQKVLGISLSAEDFALGFFTDGGHPPVALISETEMDSQKALEYKQNWLTALRGNREPAVMGSGMKVQELHLDPSETQFIDLMRFEVEQACRFWGVPPSMVFSSISGQHMTYANVTQADLHFLKHALEGKFIRIETAFTDLLPGNSYTAPSVPNTLAVVNRNAVLKADVSSRYASHKTALEARIKTVNEVRAEEDDPPFPGDEFNQPGIPPFPPTTDPNAVDGTNPTTPTKKPTTTKPTKPESPGNAT